MTSITIPDGDGGLGFTELQMSDVHRAVQRSDEIAICNTGKAPELISCFIRGYSLLVDHLAVISSQLVRAENALARRKAIVIIDEVPRLLKEKGLANARSPGGSEDIRQAFLELDVEWVARRDRVQELEAWQELLKGKKDNVEQAYLAVRKIIGDSFSFGSRDMGTNFSPAGVRPQPPAAAAAPAAEAPAADQGDLLSYFGKTRNY